MQRIGVGRLLAAIGLASLAGVAAAPVGDKDPAKTAFHEAILPKGRKKWWNRSGGGKAFGHGIKWPVGTKSFTPAHRYAQLRSVKREKRRAMEARYLALYGVPLSGRQYRNIKKNSARLEKAVFAQLNQLQEERDRAAA